MEYKNRERAENIVIYLTYTLSKIGKIPIEELDEIEDEGPLEKKYTTIFNKLSNAVAKLLDEKLINAEDEVIINSSMPSEEVTNIEAYLNFKRIDNEVGNILSKVFNGEYAFAMMFNTTSYYGMDCYAQDAFIAVDEQEIYGPIYNCASNSPDLKKYKESDQKLSRQLIKKFIQRK